MDIAHGLGGKGRPGHHKAQVAEDKNDQSKNDLGKGILPGQLNGVPSYHVAPDDQGKNTIDKQKDGKENDSFQRQAFDSGNETGIGADLPGQGSRQFCQQEACTGPVDDSRKAQIQYSHHKQTHDQKGRHHAGKPEKQDASFCQDQKRNQDQEKKAGAGGHPPALYPGAAGEKGQAQHAGGPFRQGSDQPGYIRSGSKKIFIKHVTLQDNSSELS